MSVDQVTSESQIRLLAQKRKALEDEQNALETDKAMAERNRIKEASAAKEKTDKELVAISKAGETQAEMVKKLNSERVRTLNENTQKNYLALADATASDIKRLEAESIKAIADHRAGTMERIKSVTDQTQDPFYHIKSLNPSLNESENAYNIKVALPPHEAKNLFISGEGQAIKLSLARRFQEQVKDAEQARQTKTNSFQTVIESLTLPGPFDAKGIKREYADGIVSIHIPKAGLVPAEGVPTKAGAAPKEEITSSS